MAEWKEFFCQQCKVSYPMEKQFKNPGCPICFEKDHVAPVQGGVQLSFEEKEKD